MPGIRFESFGSTVVVVGLDNAGISGVVTWNRSKKSESNYFKMDKANCLEKTEFQKFFLSFEWMGGYTLETISENLKSQKWKGFFGLEEDIWNEL